MVAVEMRTAAVGPTYAFFAFGQALYFSRQGFGRPLPAVLANAARVVVGGGGALLAFHLLGPEPIALLAMIAAGFVVYALLNAWILWRTRDPAAQ